MAMRIWVDITEICEGARPWCGALKQNDKVKIVFSKIKFSSLSSDGAVKIAWLCVFSSGQHAPHAKWPEFCDPRKLAKKWLVHLSFGFATNSNKKTTFSDASKFCPEFGPAEQRAVSAELALQISHWFKAVVRLDWPKVSWPKISIVISPCKNFSQGNHSIHEQPVTMFVIPYSGIDSTPSATE